MRSLPHLAIAGLVAMAGFTCAIAEEGAAAPAPTTAPAAEKPAKAPTAYGTVISATAEKLVVSVKAKGEAKAEEKTFTVNAQTEVIIEKAKAAITDLKADQMVKVTFEGDVAKRVEVKPAKKEHAEHKEGAEHK